ncbi:hypothetical protein DPX16_7266 [Anabarilius grahami]|uniref:Uncharacterized protein n=1 Tax=Anabarilius grahami TaxID=495550 RepID=A0A3N0XMW3_ANAGA|nr:hypothetical protein DPX16_7266 [Anabarilius grahami]
MLLPDFLVPSSPLVMASPLDPSAPLVLSSSSALPLPLAWCSSSTSPRAYLAWSASSGQCQALATDFQDSGGAHTLHPSSGSSLPLTSPLSSSTSVSPQAAVSPSPPRPCKPAVQPQASRLPRHSRSASSDRCQASTTDFQDSGGAYTLHPYGVIGLLPSSDLPVILVHFSVAPGSCVPVAASAPQACSSASGF